MENYSFYSYLTSAAAYFLLLAWSLIGIKKNPVVIPFIIAVVFSLIWSGYAAFAIHSDESFTSEILPFETLHNAAWFFYWAHWSHVSNLTAATRSCLSPG